MVTVGRGHFLPGLVVFLLFSTLPCQPSIADQEPPQITITTAEDHSTPNQARIVFGWQRIRIEESEFQQYRIYRSNQAFINTSEATRILTVFSFSVSKVLLFLEFNIDYWFAVAARLTDDTENPEVRSLGPIRIYPLVIDQDPDEEQRLLSLGRVVKVPYGWIVLTVLLIMLTGAIVEGFLQNERDRARLEETSKLIKLVEILEQELTDVRGIQGDRTWDHPGRAFRLVEDRGLAVPSRERVYDPGDARPPQGRPLQVLGEAGPLHRGRGPPSEVHHGHP
jgi:hypothetical protein